MLVMALRNDGCESGTVQQALGLAGTAQQALGLAIGRDRSDQVF